MYTGYQPSFALVDTLCIWGKDPKAIDAGLGSTYNKKGQMNNRCIRAVMRGVSPEWKTPQESDEISELSQ
jgi:hypothetical protein